eukprot:7625760-Heterocapsa_arctica.AAC.1
MATQAHTRAGLGCPSPCVANYRYIIRDPVLRLHSLRKHTITMAPRIDELSSRPPWRKWYRHASG